MCKTLVLSTKKIKQQHNSARPFLRALVRDLQEKSVVQGLGKISSWRKLKLKCTRGKVASVVVSNLALSADSSSR